MCLEPQFQPTPQHSSTLIVPYLSPLVLSKSLSTWSTLALHHTFHHSWMSRKVVSVGAQTLLFAALWTPCVSTLLLFSLTSGKPSTLAGSKPHWFVSMTWASQVVFGISLPISSAALSPRSVWATRLPNHGLTLASTALPPLSVLPSLVSALWTWTRSVTCANFTRTTWSSLLNPRPIFRMLWTSCTRGVFVGGSRLVLAPPSRRLWSSVLSAPPRSFRTSWGRLSPFGATIQVPRCHSYPYSLLGSSR